VTFSICVRESGRGAGDGSDADGRAGEGDADAGGGGSSGPERRFGVAVTTRLPGVGTLCPFASENGAVATQSRVNVDLGRKGIAYLDDGLAVDDALGALLNADDGASQRQLHGVAEPCRGSAAGRAGTSGKGNGTGDGDGDDDGTGTGTEQGDVDVGDGAFAFSGADCRDWFGHAVGGNYTVAGNLLTGEAVIEATADAYEAADDDRPLAGRLIDALAAGHEAGGDRREDLPVQSAAVLVRSTADPPMGDPAYDDLRIDASETPIADLRATYGTARRGWADAVDRYADDYEDDENAGTGSGAGGA